MLSFHRSYFCILAACLSAASFMVLASCGKSAPQDVDIASHINAGARLTQDQIRDACRAGKLEGLPLSDIITLCGPSDVPASDTGYAYAKRIGPCPSSWFPAEEYLQIKTTGEVVSYANVHCD